MDTKMIIKCYHETGLVHKNEYKIRPMRHKIEHNPSMPIMHFTQIIFKENIMDVGPHQSPIYFCMN